MPTIEYPYQFDYTYDEHGDLFPRLPLGVSRPGHSGKPVDIDAHVDSGAERSLFDGWIGASLGIDVLAGSRFAFETTMGSVLTATMHTVQLLHPELGTFELEVGFSSSHIRRNLLGRDFFNLVQIGFRERHSLFYVSARP